MSKALNLYQANQQHPSPVVKKVGGTPHIWEMRITDSYRITFRIIEREAILLRHVGTHDVLRRP